MIKFLKRVVAALAISAVAACGGGGGPTTVRLATDAGPITLGAATGVTVATALNNQAIVFPAGIPGLAAVGAPATLTFTNNGTTFTATGAGGTVTGNTTFASVNFIVITSNVIGIPAGTYGPFPFTIDFDTAGTAANGSVSQVRTSIIINGGSSGTFFLGLTVTSTGELLLNGQNIGSVTLNTTTGGTGGSN